VKLATFTQNGRTRRIVTTDELPNVHNLSLKTWVNGELRQNGNTSELIYRFSQMVEEHE
jgi:2-keto-4-pentenoate hydratase/2-oxohepta-3-ene-1,7-dioic acid hydratase in catechol pathway